MIEKLGKYEVRRELGRGAMGVVYEGYDPLIKRAVALKTIRSDQLQGDAAEGLLARFRREAEAAGRLTHPNIVAIYDFDVDRGTWYIAMELVKGRELKECFDANERFRTADIVRIMSQILAALEYSHRQGVVHRDVKPANVFLLDDGSVKVADFGIAHVESSNLTQVGTVIGTPAYMSPEQIMGLPVDGRSDLFSAGVILYQFLTGERPFSGSSTTIMQKVLKEEPLAPSNLNLQVSALMDAVVRKALAKKADERFQTAREFADALQAAAQTAPLGVSPHVVDADATVRPSMAAADVRPATVPPAVAGPSASRSRAPIFGGVALVVAAAVGAGVWYSMQRGSRDVAAAATAAGAASAASPTVAAKAAVTPAVATVAADRGSVVISAVGIADPSSPRYRADKSQLASDARADSHSQLVEKALLLLLDRTSVSKNYDLLADKLLSQSGRFVGAVVQESEPRVGKDGLMSVTTQAVVNVRALQKSLNEMSRDERVELIRANGDPRISVQIALRDADRGDAPAQPSPVAENVLKKRIQQFGFRTWSEDSPDGATAADFAVRGEAKLKRLSMKLDASGLTITKYTLSSWTVKCIDRATGEEIYFNTTMPKGVGSWPSEEEALAAIGAKIADEFSRDFFLSHVNSTGRRVVVVVDGLPDGAAGDVERELLALPAVISAKATPSKPNAFDVQLAGDGPIAERVAADVLQPLNAKLGDACFALGAIGGDQVGVAFDKRCTQSAVLSKLETNPPAALYGAPAARKKAVISNPDTLRKLSV